MLLSRGGRQVSIEDSGAPIRNDEGALTGVVLVFRDIEERRTAERSRHVLTGRLESIIQATTDGIALISRTWEFVFLNKAGRATLDVGSEIVGQNIWTAFPGMVFEGSPYVYHYHRAMDEGIASSFDTEYAEPLNIMVRVSAVPVEEGLLVVFRDITEEMLSQARLVQNEKLAAVGRLASSIAHEINNPLESVTNLLYLVRNSNDLQEVQAYVDVAERELRRVSLITNQTLRFHKQATNPVPCFCQELLADSLSLYQGRIVNSRVQVEKRKRADRSVLCGADEIRQVLNNLIGNAIDAMPEGGRLVLRSREGTHWTSGAKGVVLTVADTGTGMSPAVLKKIFDAFFTTKGIGGTGLGLWIAQDILHRHHGALRVRSSQKDGSSGSVFTLFLPFHPQT